MSDEPRFHTFTLDPARRSEAENQNQILADIEQVNNDPESDPELTQFLNYLADSSAKYRDLWDRGIYEPMGVFKMRTMIIGRTKLAVDINAPKAHRHELVLQFNDALETYKGQDLRRFRRCGWQRCNNGRPKIFWADRLNKKFCSTECLNAATQKSYRERAKISSRG